MACGGVPLIVLNLINRYPTSCSSAMMCRGVSTVDLLGTVNLPTKQYSFSSNFFVVASIDPHTSIRTAQSHFSWMLVIFRALVSTNTDSAGTGVALTADENLIYRLAIQPAPYIYWANCSTIFSKWPIFFLAAFRFSSSWASVGTARPRRTRNPWAMGISIDPVMTLASA